MRSSSPVIQLFIGNVGVRLESHFLRDKEGSGNVRMEGGGGNRTQTIFHCVDIGLKPI